MKNIRIIDNFAPHAGFAAKDETLLMLSPWEVVRVAFVELHPIGAGSKMVEVPARRKKRRKAVICNLK